MNNNELNNKTYKEFTVSRLGFTQYSEKFNGRIAMLSFLFLFIIELITKQKILDLIKIFYFN
jgi:hypothetical protein